MSRPQKIHPPLKVDFNRALAAVGMGIGKGREAAKELQRNPQKPLELKARNAPPPAKKP
jgi:hypothetical protein